MEIWQYILLFGSAFSAGLLAFFVREIPRAQLKTVLSFSGAYILGISVLHLLPDVFAEHNHRAGVWILVGFFVQLLLEQFSKGIEHGHVHPSHAPNWGFAAQVMFGLSLHAFMEGMPLTAYPTHDLAEQTGHAHGSGAQLFWGIILHEMPASFTLAALLLLSGFRKNFVLMCLIVKSLMAPLGALFASQMAFSPAASVVATALVIGLFLHIATTILFEADSNAHHQIAWEKLLAIGLGAGLALWMAA